MEYTIGIGDYAIAKDQGDVIKTYSLSSCIGIVFYDPVLKLMAMAHIALPDSGLDPQEAKRMPGRYADTAIATIYHGLKRHGCRISNIRVSVHGGGISVQNDHFKVGEKNLAAVRMHLASYGFSVGHEEVGGRFSRTLIATVSTGMVDVIRSNL